MGKIKIYSIYNSVRNININNDTLKKKRKFNIILYIIYIIQNLKKK